LMRVVHILALAIVRLPVDGSSEEGVAKTKRNHAMRPPGRAQCLDNSKTLSRAQSTLL
jgi:hypothetical protein